METLKGLKVDLSTPSQSARSVITELRLNIENIATPESKCTSFILVGGIGFGDFDLQFSDIDIWIILPNLTAKDRLEVVMDINTRYKEVQDKLVNKQLLSYKNFRHPPTFLTEDESRGYRLAFAAKIGLPIYLGVFPAIAGQSRAGELCFTEDQLMQDLAYSCSVFQENLLNPPQHGVENPLRYSYKRAIYFLRFALLYQKNKYVPQQSQLLAECEESLPEWRSAIPVLRQTHLCLNEGCCEVELREFQYLVNQAMQRDMVQFEEDGTLNQERRAKGDLRSSVFWTIEKTRWDFLILAREHQTVARVMSIGDAGSWGFSFLQIDSLFKKVFTYISNEKLADDWRKFRIKHETALLMYKDNDLVLYYNNVYQPEIVSFFDRILPFVGLLY